MNNARIMIVDDEESILMLLKTVFTKEGFTKIKLVQDSRKVIELTRDYKPDLIILDIMMPNIDGFEIIKQLRQFTICPILFLSARNDEVDKILGLGLGADDYVTKPFSGKEVVYRVKAHLRRMELIKNNTPQNVNRLETKEFIIDFAEGIIIREHQHFSLRGKELQLLKLLTDHPNMILSKEQIINDVWDDIDFGYDNTLMVHIRRIREKLESIPSKPEHIKTVKGIGYKFVLK